MITFYPRPNTQDSFIIQEVFEDNCYNLPDDMSNVVVIDIGANIGAFVAACIERNVGQVIAYEPDPRNYAKLRKLVVDNKWKNKVSSFINAVIGIGKGEDRYLSEPTYLGEIQLTGGFNTFSSEENGLKIPTIYAYRLTQDLIMDERPIWIKMDCEGGEHEIVDCFFESDMLRVSKIFGEVHTTIDNKICSIGPDVNFTLPSHEDFKLKLEQLGFTVTLELHEIDSHLALFWAER
jgi:FkbM family methyltransferase